jgi:hypothetical protein
VNRITLVVVCLVLCLAGASVPTASAASISTSSRTALTSCLQQEYLMRDTYQNIFAKYPTLTTFGTVTTDEVAMIATLKNLFAKYKITMPADTKVSAARAIAATATSISSADGIALNLERSTATLMIRLLPSADNQDVVGALTLIKTTSLGSHTTAFATEQARVSTPTPTPTQRVVSFTPSQASSVFLALLSDESVDVIEMAAGTYHLSYTIINIDRTRPIVVRPVAGATVILSGANIGGNPQFWFGLNSMAGNITMQGFIFDGYVLNQQGIVQAAECHDITLNDMVVRNSRCNGTDALPYHSWAIYIDATPTVFPTNFTANHWTIDGSAHQMSGLQVYGGSHITAIGWSVSHAYYAVYANGNARGPLTDFILDGWTISDTGAPAWGSDNVSAAISYASGQFSNMHAISSGILLNQGTPRMIDGGGNSL